MKSVVWNRKDNSVEFNRGDRVRLVAGQSAKGVNDGPGTVTQLPGDPGYSGYDDEVWVEFDNEVKQWQQVEYLEKCSA